MSLADRAGVRLWWISDLPLAVGNDGRRIVVDRSNRLLVVITAGGYDLPTQGIVQQSVIEAVRGALC